MSMKIKKGDTVKVIAGKDKDKTGKVVSVDVKNNRVVVEGVNMITKHEKPSMSNQQGGIVNKEAPIDASNVMLVVKGVPTRVGIKVEMVEKNGKTKAVRTRVAKAKENAKLLEAAIKDMETITGQKAVPTKAKNAIANFKIREGMAIGCKVTLRGEKMYEFVDRLVNLALPRVRDFRGVNPNAFDGRGNYALGIKEQLIFPEIEYDKVDKVRGMDIIFVTTANTDEEARELLTQFNMPFTK